MKKLRLMIALLLCAALLSGCAAPQFGGLSSLFNSVFGNDGEIPRFDDMEYERPQDALDDIEKNLKQLEEAFEKGSPLSTITDLLDRCYSDYYHFDTMYTLADIRYCQDTTDDYYAGELTWCMDQYGEMRQHMEDMFYLCGSSSMAEELEENYFWEGFAGEYADAGLSVYNDATLALLHRENALLTEFRDLTSAPVVKLEDGQEVELYSYLAEAESDDYYAARDAYYRQYNEELSRIYIELVKVRRELAAEMGFASYEEMAYAYSFDRDYTAEQAAEYLEEIRTQIAPLYKELEEYTLDYPYLDEEELFEVLCRATEEMGGVVEEAFSYMNQYDLFDIRLSMEKASKSFQTYLSEYDAPYLFIDPYGDDTDVLTFAHEFGHFVDAYYNYDASESIDLSEVFSQAMEYLVLDYAEGVLPEDRLENLRRYKWKDTLETFAQQASFAAFEQAVYSADPETLDADFLNDLSLQVAIDYGYYDGVSEEYYALSWVDITHFFEQPFYVISYPVSNDLALQIWELEQEERGAGLEKYLEALPRNYYGMMDTAEAVGLDNPLAPGRIAKIAADLRENLGITGSGFSAQIGSHKAA